MTKLQNQLIAGLASIVLFAITFAPARATPLLNGGFETGDLSGWSASHSACFVPDCTLYDGVVDGLPFIAPTEGNYMAMLSTPANEGQPGGAPSFAPNGLPPSANTQGANQADSPIIPYMSFTTIPGLSAPATQVWQTFSVDQPGVIQLDWNLLTNDWCCDFAYVTVFSGAVPDRPYTAPIDVLYSRDATIGPSSDSLYPITVSGTYYRQTGWQTFTGELPMAGVYTLVLGVNQEADSFQGTALLADNVRILAEPSAVALVAIGLAGLVLARRRGGMGRVRA